MPTTPFSPSQQPSSRPSPPFRSRFTRYALHRPAPSRLRYRGGVVVVLECVRDVAAVIPAWVFRARKVSLTHGRAAGRDLRPAHSLPSLSGPGLRTARPLPTISPASLAAAHELAERAGGSGGAVGSVTIASSLFGRHALERSLRAGVVLETGSPAALVMDSLVRLGYACADPACGAGDDDR